MGICLTFFRQPSTSRSSRNKCRKNRNSVYKDDDDEEEETKDIMFIPTPSQRNTALDRSQRLQLRNERNEKRYEWARQNNLDPRDYNPETGKRRRGRPRKFFSNQNNLEPQFSSVEISEIKIESSNSNPNSGLDNVRIISIEELRD